MMAGMRWLRLCSILGVAIVMVGCGDGTTGARDLGVPDAAGDLAMGMSMMPDLAQADLSAAVIDMQPPPCGDPGQACCLDGNGVASCNPSSTATAVCSGGVCVTCGVYPMGCCPGGTCADQQTCITDPVAGTFCYPCGHDGQQCCYVGDECVEQGTSCVMPDGGEARCTM